MTRAAALFSGLDKEYEAVFRFGAETDTLDTEGEIIATADIPAIAVIREAARAFSGEISQVPPVYSAVKVQGKRAYRQARDGRPPDIPVRTVAVHSFEILSWEEPDLTVRINCSKGTYIRSLARDLGLTAGSRAYCVSLRRTGIGPFSVGSAVPAALCEPDAAISPVAAFRSLGIAAVAVGNEAAAALRAGVPLARICGLPTPDADMICWTDESGDAAALTKRAEGHWSYVIVFDRTKPR